MNGFFLVDKPVGMTSHDVVRHIKHKFKLNKVGHTGTLDPFASGLLIVCVGKATKISNLLSASEKTYTGTIVFGKHYDSYDTTGQIIKEKKTGLEQDIIKEQMASFIGSYDQEPPMHSAIKIDGQKLYKLAHQGKSITRPKRPVVIHRFDLLDYKKGALSFSVHVSKGTYIRSLAVDLAEKLNTYGALSELRRTAIGSYTIKMSKTLDDLALSDIIRLDTYFEGYPKLILDDYMIHLVKNGIVLDERQTITDKPFIVCDTNHHHIAYYEPINAHQFKPIIIF